VTAPYLVDTSALSLLAPQRPEPTKAFREWMQWQNRNLFMSTVSAAEVEQGIAKLRRSGAAARAAMLTEWFERVLEGFGPNAVPLDVAIARLAGAMADKSFSSGRPVGVADTMIAATAVSLGCVVLTRNLKHFLPLGVVAIDPLAGLPD
jgi:predicted nucleic acid-binding protein